MAAGEFEAKLVAISRQDKSAPNKKVALEKVVASRPFIPTRRGRTDSYPMTLEKPQLSETPQQRPPEHT
jgi:hypothetical protein